MLSSSTITIFVSWLRPQLLSLRLVIFLMTDLASALRNIASPKGRASLFSVSTFSSPFHHRKALDCLPQSRLKATHQRYLSNKNLPQIATTDSSSFRGKTVRGEGHPAQSLKLLRHILTFIQRQYHEQSSLVFLRTISMEHEKMRGEGKKA